MPSCPACDATVGADHAYCADCGAALRETATEDDDPHDRSPLSFAVHYPVRESYEAFGVGSILSTAAIVLFPAVVPVLGYALQVSRAALTGESDPPDFEGIGGLIGDGARVVLAWLVVGGLGTVVALSVVTGLRQAGTTAVGRDFAVAVVGLATLYVLPAVIASYAATGRASRAFSQRYAVAFATSREYVTAFAGWLAMLSVTLVVGVLALLTVIGPVIVATYALYVFAAYWGYHYREAVEAGVVPAPVDTDGPDCGETIEAAQSA